MIDEVARPDVDQGETREPQSIGDALNHLAEQTHSLDAYGPPSVLVILAKFHGVDGIVTLRAGWDWTDAEEYNMLLSGAKPLHDKLTAQLQAAAVGPPAPDARSGQRGE